MQTVEILYDINEYLNGLNNIVMDEDSGDQMCQSPNYGHFVVVINKMMGDATDEELYLALMTPEPDFIEDPLGTGTCARWPLKEKPLPENSVNLETGDLKKSPIQPPAIIIQPYR